MADFGTPGFFGKLPSRGDFVSRRLPGAFLTIWDEWLQGALASSQEALGEDWLETYLTSPVWQFALTGGLCGSENYVGVMIPSVDKVGRYFPLTAAMSCTAGAPVLSLAGRLGGWFARAQDLLLETLAERPIDFETFDDQLSRAIPEPDPGGLELASPWPWAALESGTCWHLGVSDGPDLGASGTVFLSNLLEADLGAHSVWWTAGSDRVEPSCLIASSLPDPTAFTAMLDGCWSEHGWSWGALREPPTAAVPESTAPRPLAALSARSASFSDSGKLRKHNEDAFACRDDSGAWIVADGLGGHQAGEIASRMVVSVIYELPAGESLGTRVTHLEQAVRIVNRCLLVVADRDDEVALTGSTIVAFLLDSDGSGACVWAGDSRIYRLRHGTLLQLSRDHSEADELSEHEAAARHVVTRAVGGAEEIELDVLVDDVLTGDRYLLCTDGLYSEVTTEAIIDALSQGEPDAACAMMKEAALRGSAPDNFTGVVVFVDGAVDSGFLATELP